MKEDLITAREVAEIRDVRYQMEVISKLPPEIFRLLPVGLKCAYFKSEGPVTADIDEIYGLRAEDVGSSEVVLEFSIKVPLGLMNKCGEKPDAYTFSTITRQYIITVLKMLCISKTMKDSEQAKKDCYRKLRSHFQLLFTSSIFSNAVDYFWRGQKD